MNNTLFRFFSNDRLFLCFTVMVGFMGAFMGFLCFARGSTAELLVPIMSIIGICLYIAYREHQKNVMKGLMGAVLMWLFSDEFNSLLDVAVNEKTLYAERFAENYNTVFGIKVIALVLVFSIFVFHFLINSEHHSSPFEVNSNKFLCLCLILCYLAEIFSCSYFSDGITLPEICYILFKVFLMNMVICVEAKLDLFRQKREADGWTESK